MTIFLTLQTKEIRRTKKGEGQIPKGAEQVQRGRAGPTGQGGSNGGGVGPKGAGQVQRGQGRSKGGGVGPKGAG